MEVEEGDNRYVGTSAVGVCSEKPVKKYIYDVIQCRKNINMYQRGKTELLNYISIAEIVIANNI